MSSSAAHPPGLEQNARSALLGGAVLLIAGIAAVGVGYPTEGALPVVVGLALTILSIHFYGRLGPEEVAEGEGTEALGRTLMWRGALVIGVSAAVTVGTYAASDAGERLFLLALPALWGAAEAWRGRNLLIQARRPPPKGGKGQARVEKRRRLEKSAPP